MIYLVLLFEGILTFISPCFIPMLPLYLSYLAGSESSRGINSSIKNSVGFVLGFTFVFVVMGAFSATLGVFLLTYSRIIDIVAGAIIILLGLNFLNIINIPLFNLQRSNISIKNMGRFFSSVLFGMVFSVSWTPCVGAFLGSALMMAASSGGVMKGIFMLLVYSLGLGIPFILSAFLFDQIKGSFGYIKKHYRAISAISGGFLIIIGILMISGILGSFIRLLSS